MFLVTEWFGSFLLDGGRVADARPFPRDAAGLAERLHAMDQGEVLAEERELAALAPGVQVAEPRLLSLPGARLAPRAPSARREAEASGFGPALLRDAALELARRKAREALGGRDQHVVQAVQAIDDLAETANILAERLREWYGLHFPESDLLVERQEEMATLVSSHGNRDAILAHSPHLRLAKPSFGADLGPEEQAALRGFARALSTLYAQRAELERYLEGAMPGVAPNVTRLAGAALAARLLFHAGGLRRLAMLPSGTIQTLGAEKALFRHLKDGNRPPKHGVLFQHPLVHRAPPRVRGAVARALAGKLAIAAKADALSGHDLGEALERQLHERVEALRRAPPRRAQPRQGRPPRPGPPSRAAGQGPPPGAGTPQGRPLGHARPGTGAPRGPQAGRPGGKGPPPRRRDRRHGRGDRR